MGIIDMQFFKKHKSRIYMGLLLLLSIVTLLGCTSSRKEELHEKLTLGDQLLQEEKFDEALKLYVTLLEDFQDNLTIMEKIEYSEDMKMSRENLDLAINAMDEENFKEAVEYLKKIPKIDEKAVKQKNELHETIKKKYIEKADRYVSEESYDIAMEVLGEYQSLLGEDPEIEEKLELILFEKNNPVEVVKKVIVIDAAHQEKPDLDKEPIGPGSDVTRSKATVGTTGIKTKTPEYVFTLELAKQMEQVLIASGYDVYLTREEDDVNMSNLDRSTFANEHKADLFIRLHGNSGNDLSLQGIEMFYPSKDNIHVGNLSEPSEKASMYILSELIKTTGANSQGVYALDNMPEHNFSMSPVVTLLPGYMTNREEDELLQTTAYQVKLAEGLKNGLNLYFESLENRQSAK